MSSIESALSLLELFDVERREVSVGEAARLTGLPKSSVSRLFKTLESRDFVTQDSPRGAFSVGPALNRLGRLYLGGDALVDAIEDAIVGLVERTGATGYLTRIDGRNLEIARVYEGSYPIRLVHPVGTIERTNGTSAGLASILRRPRPERDAMLADSPIETSAIKDIERDWIETGTVRLSSAVYRGFNAIGAAVEEGKTGQVYGLSLSYPETLLPPADERKLRMDIAEILMRLAAIGDDHFLKAFSRHEGTPAVMETSRSDE